VEARGWPPLLALTVSAYYRSLEKRRLRIHKAIATPRTLYRRRSPDLLVQRRLRATQDRLRRSEISFRSLVMNAPYGICRCDATGILQNAKPRLVSMFGYASAAELQGRHLGSLYADAQQCFKPPIIFTREKNLTSSSRTACIKDGSAIVRVFPAVRSRTENKGELSKFSWRTLLKPEPWSCNSGRRRRWKRSVVLAGGIAHRFQTNLLMVISGYSEFLLERLGADPSCGGGAGDLHATQRATSLTPAIAGLQPETDAAPKVLELNDVVAENLKMLTRMIGEDIDLVMVPGAALGRSAPTPARSTRSSHETWR